MIVGIGNDIATINRIGPIAEHDQGIFRIFAEHEHEYCQSKRFPNKHYAGHWAAKEAYIKANGNPELRMGDIKIIHSKDGAPMILVENKFTRNHVHVSISHERKYATAVVIIEENV